MRTSTKNESEKCLKISKFWSKNKHRKYPKNAGDFIEFGEKLAKKKRKKIQATPETKTIPKITYNRPSGAFHFSNFFDPNPKKKPKKNRILNGYE